MFTLFIACLVGTDLPLLTADNSMTISGAIEETKNMLANCHGNGTSFVHEGDFLTSICNY